MRSLIFAITNLLLACALVAGCSWVPRPVHEEVNSVYYWKTVFHPDSADLDFIKTHDVRRMYMRMFDVTADAGALSISEKTVPNASVKINEDDYYMLQHSLSDIEFVPVVYITLDALKAMNRHEGVLASNIVARVRNMCLYNALPNVEELQLDCDWTASTESSFFKLCDSVRMCIDELQLPWRVSSTIRLHQLSRKAPPVDNCVLMVYNTGSFNNPDAGNSILSVSDVKPYLKHLSDFPLHLDVAYPTYSWQLLFRKRQFVGLLNGVNLSDTARFSVKGRNVFVARRDIPYRDKIIRKGDMIRAETSAYEDIIEVKALIEDRLSCRRHSNIIYHLDSRNLSNYTYDEIENILSTDF